MLLTSTLFGQSNKDSLQQIWDNSGANAEDRMGAMDMLVSGHYMKTYPDSANYFAGLLHELAVKEGNIQYQSTALTSQGNALRLMGNPSKAIEKFTASKKLCEQSGDEAGVARNTHYIGGLYLQQGDQEKGLEYMNEALKIRTEIGDQYEIAKSYNSIGYTYDEMGEYDKALTYHRQCLEIRKRIGDRQGESWCYNNMARVYYHMDDFETAEQYYLQSIAIKEELNEYTLGETQGNLGLLYLKMGRSDEALQLCQQGLINGEKVGFQVAIRLNCDCLYQSNKAKGNTNAALHFFERYVHMRDSVYNAESARSLVQNELQYEYEMQQALDDAETEKKLELAAEKEDRQKLITYGVGVGAIVLAVLLGIIIFWLRKARSQKKIIEMQVQIVDQKNHEILDSIKYAKRIQSAILPPDKVLSSVLKNFFVLYKPKDIVAGDFYWVEQKGGATLFAAADCTGHGVPGAMVSVICNGALNRAVREFNLSDPGQILDRAREIVIQEFEKSQEEMKDGMDVALCSLEGSTLKYAGANNPLWIVRNEEILEYKADKQPIGKFDNATPYTTHTIEVEKGDCVYIFSDGYVDQFGGGAEKAKKFKPKNLRKLFLSMQNETMTFQQEKLDETFENWKGDMEQVDDVCVIGVRI